MISSYLIEDGLRARFILDHHFLERYLELPPDKKGESIMHKLMLLANSLNELDISLLFAGEKVMKHAEDLIGEKAGYHSVKRHLLRFLVNVQPDKEDTSVGMSTHKLASQVGFKNYIISPNSDAADILKKNNPSYEIKTPDDAYHLIIRLIKIKGLPITT
ncbi:MAG TPA: hypothetical protein VJC16_03720 [Candidatus Nanoarchaeia archaeon]|nr:hypothetical protein [Candidatus Nanoarchaeia archaeon]